MCRGEGAGAVYLREDCVEKAVCGDESLCQWMCLCVEECMCEHVVYG